MSTRSDGLRDAMALITAELTGDAEGQRVILEHADRASLIDGLVTACSLTFRILADEAQMPPADLVSHCHQKIL